MKIIYNLGIIIYTALAQLISPFNSKARLYVKGRIGWYKNLAEKISPGDKYIWIHCASLGEFEQGRPVIEKVKKDMPDYKIILTFFSPSGYEIQKNYQLADIICYLPYDTTDNAGKFISLVDPVLVIFVKYEFWYNFISGLKNKNIPLYLISGIFRKEQIFFRWYGSFFRKILKMFSRIFVQDTRSLDLLRSIGIENVSLAGDTRFDRVIQIAGNAIDIFQIERFRGEERLFLAGSSWKQDEEIISQYINRHPDKMKWVFAPHEIDISNIERLEKLIRVRHVRFSQFSEECTDARVMIIDNIGMLSSAYRYADIAAVGGGFGKGIHNILEPACWGMPVLFGPNHEKFREAEELVSAGGAKSFDSYDSFSDTLELLLGNKILYSEASETARKYVRENAGATDKILKEIS
jgi:3-deoxy-D-manno-octulosonic-acid transferase